MNLNELNFEPWIVPGCYRTLVKFDNGIEVSILKGAHPYSPGLIEIREDGEDPVTGDEAHISSLLDKIKAKPR